MKLSIVLATRGDFYGGDNVAKTLRFVKTISKKMLRLKEKSFEIIIVDYNTVPNRKIAQFISLNLYDKVKIIEVQPDQINGLVTKEIPFIEYHAKNIGVKNARGAQILVVNSDVRISKGSLRACLNRPFLNTSFLRTDRTDLSFHGGIRAKLLIHTRGGEEGVDKTQLRLLEKNFFKGSKKLNFEDSHEHFLVSPEGGIPSHFMYGAHGNASGDFICAPSWAWNKVKGYQEKKYLSFMGDSFLICGFFNIALRQVVLPGFGRTIHIDHSRPIPYRNNWSEENWNDFKIEFRRIASGEKDYKFTEEAWGVYS